MPDAPKPTAKPCLLHGLVPPLPTPFAKNGDLDSDALQALIAQLAPMVDGFLLLGSNGEAVVLSEQERARVLAAGREAIPKNKTMLVGTGGENSALVMERNRLASESGADAVLVIAPHYYRGAMDAATLEVHFRAVANASPLPVYVYNIPQVTGFAHPPTWLARLGTHPNVFGLKDSSGDVTTLGEIVRVAPTLNTMTGHAPSLMHALALGAAGGILAAANVIPQQLKAIMQAMQDKDPTTARALQQAVNPIAFAVTRDYGVPGLKAILRAQGLPAGYPRAPLLDVDAKAIAAMQAMLEGL